MRKQVERQLRRSRYYSDKEKRNYYQAWERSGQSKVEFSDSIGVARSTFYQWCNKFKTEQTSAPTFSPVTIKRASPQEGNIVEPPVKLEICLPNQTTLCLSMQRVNLISFIQELSHATSTVR